MKYLIILIILGGVAAGGFLFWQQQNKKEAAQAAAASVQTMDVARRNIEKAISANGKVASNLDVEIKCQASGKVIKLPYDISDKVKVGDLLLELDPIDQQRLLDQAQAQMKASEARVAQAKINLEVAKLNVTTSRQRATADLASAQAKLADAQAKEGRTSELMKSNLASAEELETAKTTTAQAAAAVLTSQAELAEVDQQEKSLESKNQDIATAEAQLVQDTAKRDTQQLQVDYTKVYVPDDAASKIADYRVSLLSVQPGGIVQSGSSGISGGTTVMKLADLSHMFVLAEVDESDIGLVTDPAFGGGKQPAKITVEAQKGIEFDGEVVRVATAGVTTQNVTTFEVKVEVTDARRFLLKPEMTATAKIIVAARSNVLAIPIAAFRPGEKAGATGSSGDATAPATAPSPAAGSEPATRRGGRGGRGTGPGGVGGGSGGRRPLAPETPPPPPGTPMEGTVQVQMEDGKIETRDVTVGLSDDNYYEVLKGVDEGEKVLIRNSSDGSRFRNPNPNGRGIPGVPGLGRGGR